MSSCPSSAARQGAGPALAQSAAPARLQPGTEAFRRITRATFIGGFCTFAMLYGAQPLMPVVSGEFGISPATASGMVSAATGALAMTLIPASMLADRIGRRPVMNWALALAAVCSLLCAIAPGFHQLLLWRGVLGVVLAGMPAVAMAYISEEVDPEALGRAMGLYIAGNALGGMSGRFMSAVIADWSSWRWAMGVVGAMGCAGAYAFWRMLPPSRHFRPSSARPAAVLADARRHLADPALPWLFLLGFLLMGCFVSLYNYLGYRLVDAPFNLSTSQIGAIFLLYLVGVVGSSSAGRLGEHFGRRNVPWMMICMMLAGLALTLSHLLPLVVCGVGLYTFAFFGAHSTAASWVGRRAQHARALAAALYLCAYYLGSSLVGSLSGLLWHVDGWFGVAAGLGAALLLCLGVCLRLRRLM